MENTMSLERAPGVEHITFDASQGLTCTCGWTYHKPARKKVFLQALEKHQRKFEGHVYVENEK